VAQAFFDRLWRVESRPPTGLLFEHHHYYTYMAGQTPSELARRWQKQGASTAYDKSVWGFWWLGILDCAVFTGVYPATCMTATLRSCYGTRCSCGLRPEYNQRAADVVIDKGMNADGNMPGSMSMRGFISLPPTHPILPRSCRNALERFEPVDTPAKPSSIEQDQEQELPAGLPRTKAEYGQEACRLIVTYNPVRRAAAYTLMTSWRRYGRNCF